MLGMTLAAPAGELLVRMILTDRRPSELAPFGIDRFRASLAPAKDWGSPRKSLGVSNRRRPL